MTTTRPNSEVLQTNGPTVEYTTNIKDSKHFNDLLTFTSLLLSARSLETKSRLLDEDKTVLALVTAVCWGLKYKL